MKLEYNRENDEKTKTIGSKVGVPTILYIFLAIVLVGLVILYFPQRYTVGITLYVVGIAQIVVLIIIKFIYTRIM